MFINNDILKNYNFFFRYNLGHRFNFRNFNLLSFLRNSYNNFLQWNVINKKNIGLQKVFNKLFPFYIPNFDASLEFISYSISPPLRGENYCIDNGLSYFFSLKVDLCLILNYSDFDNRIYNKETIFFSIIPMITNNCTFIINGIEKVIISKLVRSPGIYFLKNKKKKHIVYYIKLVPDKGYDLQFLLNSENNMVISVKKRELFITTIFKVFGYNSVDIINEFYNFEYIYFFNNDIKLKFIAELFLNSSIPYDIIDSNKSVIVIKNNIINSTDIDNIKKSNIEFIDIDFNYLIDRYLGEDLFYKSKLIFKASTLIDKIIFNKIKSCNFKFIKIVKSVSSAHNSIINTLCKDNSNYEESINILYDFFNYIGFAIIDTANLGFKRRYIYKNYFDISSICRIKINQKLKRCNINNVSDLTIDDFLGIARLLIAFKDGVFKEDDMQNLDNLNLHLASDMVENIIYDNLYISKKIIYKSFSNINKDYYKLKPSNFINFRQLSISLKNFFNISQYSQFLDQINILSEISHKRRVSFLGIIGISRKHSGFDVRDLSSSYYSRLCPVETPEGINIGLIGSLSIFCNIDINGFLTAPYHRVKNFKVSNKIIYLILKNESNYVISDYNNLIFKNRLKKDYINARYNNGLINVHSSFVDYIDISPYQMLSISTCLIPFIEHNDSNRALMASNMLRQALPCLFPQRPLIATGLEKIVALNSETVITSNINGIVDFVDSSIIVLKKFFIIDNFYHNFYYTYFLYKYRRSNQNTDISQRPVVFPGQVVSFGDVLADGSCTDMGELSLGQNVFVAFMCFSGYNFEDSIIVSEKLVIDDRYTSLDLTQIDISVYDTDYGYEYITKDIYNVNNVNLDNISDLGIIKVGSTVFGGDILVGKITPVSDFDDSIAPEDRLMKSIFFEKDLSEIDSSFYLPNNMIQGTVSKIEHFFSNNYDLKLSDKKIFDDQLNNYLNSKKNILKIFLKKIKFEIKNFLIGKEILSFDSIINNCIITKNYLKNFNLKKLFKIKLREPSLNEFFFNFKKKFKKFFYNYKIFKDFILNYKFKKNFPVNIIKVIRISIIIKKKLKVGDKMSGRHGNKGVISKILPVNEMPYMSNGNTIDIILNPLGIPSRMNVGQLLEVHLGLASVALGWRIFRMLKNNDILNLKKIIFSIYNKYIINYDDIKRNDIIFLANYLKNGIFFAIPPFSKFKEDGINNFLDLAFIDSDLKISNKKKQIYLYDGKTSKKIDKPVTVGIMYFFKLNHLVEDKIHARSTGPYSLVTQQPLKGKSNFGGQRVGEMEVWALEAYGASNTLQEMMTIKSDDVIGRFDAYRNIINNNLDFSFGRPETFDVMMENINSLGLFISFRSK